MSSPKQEPPSPSASFYAMSDDEEGEYNTIRHTSSGRGVKLLYTKSKVYVHPSPHARDNLAGFIALIQQKPASLSPSSPTSPSQIGSSSLLLAWVPESDLSSTIFNAYVKVDLSGSSSPPKQSYLVPLPPTNIGHASSSSPGYAFAIPVSEIYSLLVRPPSIGWWFGSVVINTRAGDSFPALFFHDSECESTILQRKKLARESFDPFGDGGGMFWGGDEVLRWLKRYVRVERSGADPNIFLIEPSEEDRLGFSIGIDGKRARRPSSGGSPAAAGPSSPGPSNAQPPGRRDGGMDPVTKALKEARWNILEKLSQVTTFTRRTAQAVAENKNLPPQLRNLMRNPEVQTLQEEFDSARIYLARWAMGISEQGDRERQQRIWTAKDIMEQEETELGTFEILEVETRDLSINERRDPVTMIEWKKWFDAHGRLEVTVGEVKERVFHGGLDPDDGVRKEAWMFLLGVYDWNSSAAERHAMMNSKRDEYIRLKGKWWDRMVDGESGNKEAWGSWKEQKNMIEKDVHRTDRHVPLFAGEDTPHPDPNSPFADAGTNVHLEQMKDMLLTYNEYNRELGYVQGMSDLLAPIYAVCQDDAIAFWGFVSFMNRMERNFLRDQSGMRLQLLTLDQLVQLMDPQLYLHLQSLDSTNFFFFFRPLLVWYKREFPWPDVLRLWESLWTDHLSANFHLFVALAILEKHRAVILEHLQGFDEVLKYVNELANAIDLNSTLLSAEALFLRFRKTVDAVDRKNILPEPPTPRRAISTESVPAPPKSPSDTLTPPMRAALKLERRPEGDNFPGSEDTFAEAATGGNVLRDARPGMTTHRRAASASASASEGGSKNPVGTRRGSGVGRASANVASGSGAGGIPTGQLTPREREKVITPELRALLSREVPWMAKEEVKRHGGGVS
ncbi:RabGAP/TBC [Eremomyces bilateralis CBS 781.70]|uniref:GTPase-activating protein GYP7 n=1 Tax=Eremomyces bilateralis CBS 781.70 TaxID=1392243 RepID=A0A6G1G9C2_9PEZI|nr:RabGAP/TBC [Eremomyces bilateralis CBS 781.70]KAF1814634.1 RabGAP/TBC [Eremomyces bilateralis CBS 781.70]